MKDATVDTIKVQKQEAPFVEASSRPKKRKLEDAQLDTSDFMGATKKIVPVQRFLPSQWHPTLPSSFNDSNDNDDKAAKVLYRQRFSHLQDQREKKNVNMSDLQVKAYPQ